MKNPKPNRKSFSPLHGTSNLIVSGLYGMIAGAAFGGVIGGAVGIIEPFYGNIIGLFLGSIVGGLAGFPTGIIGAALEEREGWRLAGGFSILTVGLGFLWASHPFTLSAWTQLLFAVCVHLGFWAGGKAHDRIRHGTGFYYRWNMAIRCNLRRRQTSSCLPLLLTVLVPVAALYTTLFHSLHGALTGTH